MRPDSKLPPVVVLGVDSPIGLTVVRELGERGVPVHGIARAREGLGLHSRWLARGHVRPPQEAAMLGLVQRIARESGAPFAMAVSMNDVLALRRAADAGTLGALRPLVAPQPQLDIVNSKAAVCTLAAEVGIAVPRNWQPEPGADPVLPPALTFPCVMKWSDPDAIAPLLAYHGLPLEKLRYAYTPDALLAALARFRAVGRYPLVQSFAPGFGLGQMFVMQAGRAVLRFQHRRLAEWPPEGGTSVVCESVGVNEHADLMRRSEALLHRIGWSGPAMVEYRFDPAAGAAVLMEINGRFWGSLPLAYHAGAHFAWATYATLGLERPELVTATPRAGVCCRYVLPESKRLAVILLRPGSIQNRQLRFCRVCEMAAYLVRFLQPRTRYFVFTWRDPGPFLADITHIVGRVPGTLWRQVTRVASSATRFPRNSSAQARQE